VGGSTQLFRVRELELDSVRFSDGAPVEYLYAHSVILPQRTLAACEVCDVP
jgi:hypothetical protein